MENEAQKGLETLFSHSGTNVNVFQMNRNEVTTELAAGFYSLNYNPISGFYLKVEERPVLPKKIYGSHIARAEKVIRTYKERAAVGKSTGVLSVGEKGQGKTMLTELIATMCCDSGVPVILINTAYEGVQFAQFLNLLGDVVIIFDEFAKLYGKEKENQDGLLTIFDGTMSRPRLILLTENNEHQLNSFLLDRPGRIYYKFVYGKLDVLIIEQVCEDKGVAKDVAVAIADMSTNINGFSMDMLNAVIEEHLRFPDMDITVLVQDMNISVRTTYNEQCVPLEIITTKEYSEEYSCRVNIRIKDLSVLYDIMDWVDVNGKDEWQVTEKDKEFFPNKKYAKSHRDGVYVCEVCDGVYVKCRFIEPHGDAISFWG